jgi:hypothetical protein
MSASRRSATSMSTWEVEYTDEFEAWWEQLTEEQQEAIAARVALLEQRGPLLRRPYIGEISGSTFDPQMKELICDEDGGHLRILFMFDPRRVAILLWGGDKTGLWNRWYPAAIQKADELYGQHLKDLENEG